MDATVPQLHDIRSLAFQYFRERRAFGELTQSPSYGQAGDFLHTHSFHHMVLSYEIGLELHIEAGLLSLCEEGVLDANASGIFLTEKGAKML